MCLCERGSSVCRCPQRTEDLSDRLEIKLQVIVGHPTWVLGISSGCPHEQQVISTPDLMHPKPSLFSLLLTLGCSLLVFFTCLFLLVCLVGLSWKQLRGFVLLLLFF